MHGGVAARSQRPRGPGAWRHGDLRARDATASRRHDAVHARRCHRDGRGLTARDAAQDARRTPGPRRLAGRPREASRSPPCALAPNDATVADAPASAVDARTDGEASAGFDPTVEELLCDGLACLQGASCCAPFDGGPPRCVTGCDGVLIACSRDAHCHEGTVCCAQATGLRNGDQIDTFSCATAGSGCGYQVCNDPARCVEEAGCAYPGGATRAPRYCLLRQ